MPRPCPLSWPAAVLLSLSACGPDGGAGNARVASESAPREVRTALVGLETWERSVPAAGELAPWERVVLGTKVAGRLEALLVDRGDSVHAGQVLARLESREYEYRVRAAQAAVGAARALLGLPTDDGTAGANDEVDPATAAVVSSARAELERARMERERIASLARDGIDSRAASERVEADFLAAESRLQEAFELVATRRATLSQRRAELELARAQLAETEIEAPFDARVVRRLAAPGAYLAPGGALCELVRVDPLRLRMQVSERESAEVRVGQTVIVHVAGRAAELRGPIARLAPALDDASRSLVLEVDLANPEAELRSGAFAEGRVVVLPEEPALTLPIAALTSFAGLEKALVVRDGKTEERRLVLGRRAPERVEVLSGLEAGDEVVLDPGKLGVGAAVRVLK